MNILKKLGWILVCVVILIIGFLIQMIGSIIGILPGYLKVIMENSIADTNKIVSLEDQLLNVSLDAAGESLIIAHGLLLIVFGIWYCLECLKKQKTSNNPTKQVKIFTLKNLTIIIMVSFGMCILTNSIIPFAYIVFPNAMNSYQELMENAGLGVNTLSIIAAVCVAPIGEEFIFRGTMMHYARNIFSDLSNRKIAFWLVNIMQAFFFGVFHFNIVQGIYAFFIGLVLGYLVEYFGSIIPAMIGHFVINGTSTFLWEPIYNLLPDTLFSFMVLAIISIILIYTGFNMCHVRRTISENS